MGAATMVRTGMRMRADVQMMREAAKERAKGLQFKQEEEAGAKLEAVEGCLDVLDGVGEKPFAEYAAQELHLHNTIGLCSKDVH